MGDIVCMLGTKTPWYEMLTAKTYIQSISRYTDQNIVSANKYFTCAIVYIYLVKMHLS